MKSNGVISKPIYSTYERQLEKEIHSGRMPNHIAIIMDGNRRYATENLESDINAGHKAGDDRIEDLLDWCLRLNIHYITLYAFSTENFKRDSDEVDFIMELAESELYRLADDKRIHDNKVGIRLMGQMDDLPESVIKARDYAYRRTAGYTNIIFTVAMAYGSRQEIINAAKEIARKVKDGSMDIDDIDENVIASHLYTADLPDPDLVLRTSGEIRLSNFLLWQLAYSELYFTDVYWPSFRYIDLLRAIRTYQERVRRYGE